VPLLSPPSRRPSIVVLENTAESFPTLDAAVNVEFVPPILDQLVLETLVITLKVIVLRVFLHGRPKVALAEWDDLGQTLGLDGANESLRVGIQVGTAGWKLHRPHTGGSENFPERLCEQRIAIVDETASSLQESFLGIREIASNLHPPISVRPLGDPRNLDSASLEIENAQAIG
jgi:hypothetical protein